MVFVIFLYVGVNETCVLFEKFKRLNMGRTKMVQSHKGDLRATPDTLMKPIL